MYQIYCILRKFLMVCQAEFVFYLSKHSCLKELRKDYMLSHFDKYISYERFVHKYISKIRPQRQ